MPSELASDGKWSNHERGRCSCSSRETTDAYPMASRRQPGPVALDAEWCGTREPAQPGTVGDERRPSSQREGVYNLSLGYPIDDMVVDAKARDETELRSVNTRGSGVGATRTRERSGGPRGWGGCCPLRPAVDVEDETHNSWVSANRRMYHNIGRCG